MRFKDTLTCPIGHKIEMSFNNFKTGFRCKICSGNIIHSPQYVFDYYKKYGYTLKSIYKGNKIKDELICPKGHTISISFHNFKNHNRRCGVCFLENNIGENHISYKSDRTRSMRSGYLQFRSSELYRLSDDPLYNNYIKSQVIAKNSNKNHIKSNYTVDHIYPRIAFVDNNLDNLYDKKIIKEIANTRENLRILTKSENSAKSGKYNQEEFMNWFTNKLILYLMRI